MTDAATPETATAASSIDIDGAANAIERILTKGEAGISAPPRRKRPDPAMTDAAAATADGQPLASGTEESQETAPIGEDDAVPGEPDEGREDDDGQPRYTVKVDGEEKQVSVDELVRGYQRNADYTRKTMKLAEERRELAALRDEASRQRATAEAERRQYTSELDAAIPALREQLLQHFGGIDWARLAAEEPARFAELSPQFEALSSQLQQAEAARLGLRQQQRQQEAALQQARLRHRNEQWRALVTHLPELAEPAKARREVQAMTDYLVNAGYSRDELDRLVDHRDFILARKAMLYDRMSQSADKVEEKVRTLPKVQRPGAAPARGDRGGERRTALMNRLRRSGSTEDAARAIEELL
jgi:hypothetical protein